MKTRHNQRGLALLVLVFFLTLIITGYAVQTLDSTEIKNERDKKTAAALAEAKLALLGYASSVNLGSCSSATNCARPGDLPCPDRNNDGVAETGCGNASGSTNQAFRLGRLPWRTLALPDLRDGDGERLWYAVSSRYKYNTRYRPLNTDTVATITVRNSSGAIINNGVTTIGSGAVAVLIAPGAAIVRADSISQVRDGANENVAVNYLDVALGEDNQNFTDGNTNGFIMGIAKDGTGRTILNDKLLTITRNEMNQVMEARALAEVKNHLRSYYSALGGRSYPQPANFNDTGCLGGANIVSPNCPEGTLTHGRIPANPSTPWDATSILRGQADSNWFQLNAWREVIYYAVAPACVTGTTNCSGVGFLTLNNALVTPTSTKEFVLIGSSVSLGAQVRATNANRTQEVNYLENENLTPLDDTYVRTLPMTSLINDRAISFP
ncbi:MAG: hypothetical protein ACT4OH_08135 [Methylophilaceae bacterium]